MSEFTDVMVVGAGLAGRRAAQVLNVGDRHVILVGAPNHVGGRLSSHVVAHALTVVLDFPRPAPTPGC